MVLLTAWAGARGSNGRPGPRRGPAADVLDCTEIEFALAGVMFGVIGKPHSAELDGAARLAFAHVLPDRRLGMGPFDFRIEIE